MSYIDVRHNYKRYQTGDTEILANNDVSFTVEKGELAIILGASGAGKSTILNILGGMDTNTSGDVIIDGKNIAKYNKREFYNLILNLTARENVELASEIVPDALDPVKTLIDVGLKNRINNFPAELSGGEQQRVAIARAIAKNPKILLCDEPTGALDYQTGKSVLQTIINMSHNNKTTVVIVTHNSALAPLANRVIHFHDGQVTQIDTNQHPEDVANIKW